MFRQVLLFEWSEAATEGQRQALRDGLAALATQIPEVRSISFGDDMGLYDDTWDFAVITDFDDVDAALRYAQHPAHQAFVAVHARPSIERRAVVQFETPVR